MHSKRSQGLQLIAAATFSLGLFAGMPSLRAEAALPVWAQAQSDVPAESDIRFGVLANGMRYAILKNATPAGQAAVRLQIASGSLQESDAQQGLAHFLEHMAFKGSTHVPEGEMVKILQRKGLAFGPDTNAQTSYDKTLFMLDLPETDADTISTSLMLMRETASELKLDASAFDHERGVILSEERLRDTPDYRGMRAFLNLLLAGQRIPTRAPIGLTDVIRNAPVDLVHDYYRANYRPDRATLIVVGDIDPDKIEAEIKARFSDWAPNGDAVKDPDLGVVQPRGMSADVIEVPGGATKVQIAWVRPSDHAPDSIAKRRQEAIEDIGLQVLNRRVTTRERETNPPYINAEVAAQDLYHSARIAIVMAVSAPDRWRTALDAIEQQQRQLAQFGVRQDEVDREIVEFRASLKAQADGQATRTSTEIATQIATSVSDGKVFTSPVTDLQMFDDVVKGLTAAEVNAALQPVFAGSGPLVVLQTGKAPEGGAAAVKAAYDRSYATPLTAQADAAAPVWPYTHFGVTGVVAERRDVPDLGLVLARFANGVRVTVKPTKFKTNEVLVRADIGHGRLDLPADRRVVNWATRAYVAGGLKKISQEDMERALAAAVASVEFRIDDNSFLLSGTTQPADLGTQLQILAAYATEPAFRPEAFTQVQNAFLSGLPQYSATPSLVISRDLPGLLHSGDPRWLFPDEAHLKQGVPSDLGALLDPLLASAPIEITIVGDVKPDDAIRMAADTFGALPMRTSDDRPQANVVRFPAPNAEPVMRTHTGRADQAGAVVAWPIGDLLSDIPRAYAVNIASEVLQNRLIEQFRIAEGATYSPQTDVSLSQTFPGYGYLYSYVETPPAKIAGFFALVSSITQDMRDKDVGPDELARAREPRIERVKKLQQTNQYWQQYLDGVQTDPRKLDLIRSHATGYEKVTVEDVRNAARAYLMPATEWRFEAVPEAAPAPAAAVK